MSLRPNEPVISDAGTTVDLFPPDKGRGLVPRDYAVDPPEMFAPPDQIKLIPRAVWPELIRQKVAERSQLSDIRLTGDDGRPIPSIDQGPNGYCWSHSVTQAVVLVRAANHQPYVPLSAYAVAATIKKGVNEGGWCGLAAKFVRERGIPSQALWPQGDRNYQKYAGRADVWENAARHKVTEDWVDLTRSVYDQNLTFDMVVSLLLSNVPCALDYNHWAHSIAGLDAVDGAAQRATSRAASGKLFDLAEFDRVWGLNDPVTGGFGVRIWNSWGNSWGDRGMGVLTGQKAVPDGAIAQRVVPGSTN